MRVRVLTLALMLLAGCASSWDNYGPSLYGVLQEPSVETMQSHLELLARIIENARSDGRRPPPGMQAEYAYYARRLGRTQEAKEHIAAEARDYPEARTFLAVFERYLDTVSPISMPGEFAKGEGG